MRHTETHKTQRQIETNRDRQRHTESNRDMMLLMMLGDLHPWATCTH